MSTHERTTRVADRHSFPGDLTRIRTLLQDAKSYLLRALESPLPDSQASIATFPVSNSPLPSLQHQTVKEDISALTTHAHTLEAQASLARTIVECLEAQSKRFSAKAEDLKVVIAPHKSLPDYLLSEIFLATVDHALCIPSQSWLSYGRVDPTTEAPWSLLQVCSRWRRIALEDVRLWNKLRLLYRLNIPGARQLTQRALFYSKNSQLYLCGTDEETHSLRLSDDLIRDVLIPHSTRIVHGNFHLSTSVQFSNSPPYFRSAGSIDLPNLPPSHAFLPSLKKLSLSIEHNPDYPIDDAELWKTVNFFLGSSRLVSLRLTLNGRQISSESCFPLNLPLRWETLKCLRIEDTEIAPSTAYRLLTMTAANLTEVGLQVAPFVQPVQMLELPHLRLMYLVGHSARILDTLKADNLTEFYFRPPGSPQSFSIWQANLVLDEMRAQKESNTIQSFLMRSSAPLHHLHLVLPSFSLDLDPFLRPCPSLETVEALYNKLSISTIQHMTKARLWPKDMAVSMQYADLPFLEVSLSKQFANFRNSRKRKLAPFAGCPRSMKIIPFNDHSRPLSVREVRPQTAYNQMEARLMNVCPQKLRIQLMPYESLINRV